MVEITTGRREGGKAGRRGGGGGGEVEKFWLFSTRFIRSFEGK